LFALLFVFNSVCQGQETISHSFPSQKSESQISRLLNAVAEAERRAQNKKPPEPKISLVTPPGWLSTETRALPQTDNGFSVGYKHESGLTVTLYLLAFFIGIVDLAISVSADAKRCYCSADLFPLEDQRVETVGR